MRRSSFFVVMVSLVLLAAAGCDAEGSFPLTTTSASAQLDGGMLWPDMELVDGVTNTTYEAPQMMYAHSGEVLYKIDPETLQVSEVGAFAPNAPHMTDLAVTPDGQLYSVSNNNLYKIDPLSARVTWVAYVPGTVNVALTFDVDGTLLASDKAGSFRRIDPNTGAVTEVGAYGAGLGSSGDLVAIKDGTLYGVNDVEAKGNNTLLKVDPVSGEASVVGPIGFRMVWGLSFWGGTLYGFTRLGHFISIDPQTAKGTLIHSFSAEFWGAAVTPKAPLTLY